MNKSSSNLGNIIFIFILFNKWIKFNFNLNSNIKWIKTKYNNMFINKLASIRPEFFFNHKARLFFLKKKKRTCVWQSLSYTPRYICVSPKVPLTRTEARRPRTHTHPKLYWFLRLTRNCIYSPHKNSNLRCGETSEVTYRCIEVCNIICLLHP